MLPLGVYSVLFYKTNFTSSTSRKNLLVDACSKFSGFLGSSVVKNLPAMQGLQKMGVQSWGWKIPWRRKWQPTSVFLPGQSSWTEEPGGLQSMGSQESDTAEHRHTLKILSRCFRCRMYYASVVWESPCSMGSPGFKRSLRDVGKGWVI